MLLRTTIDNETIKNNNNEGLHLKTLLFSYIYKIQTVQKTTQLSSMGRFN
jgi:hypothetical protein